MYRKSNYQELIGSNSLDTNSSIDAYDGCDPTIVFSSKKSFDTRANFAALTNEESRIQRKMGIMSSSMDTNPSICSSSEQSDTKHQRFILFSLALVEFTCFATLASLAPFFPEVASKKGVNKLITGFIFSIYSLTFMVFCLPFGKLIPFFGNRFVLLAGLFLAAGSSGLFGILDRIQDPNIFAIMCIIMRAFQGFSTIAISTSVDTLVMELYTGDINYVFSVTQTASGFGMALGPALGSTLYKFGFGWIFYVMGLLYLVTLGLCWYFIPFEGMFSHLLHVRMLNFNVQMK